MSVRVLVLACALGALPGCLAPDADASAALAARRADPGSPLADLERARRRPLEPPAGHVHVLVFVTTDCPISNAFAPEIRAIAAEHAADPVRFFLVHVDWELTAEAARAHAAEFGYELPILVDREHTLVRATGASVTPEAVVVTDSGAFAYRGRIDDRFADLGVKRRAPTRRDLRDALEALLAGRAPPVARTQAVGCLIPDLP